MPCQDCALAGVCHMCPDAPTGPQGPGAEQQAGAQATLAGRTQARDAVYVVGRGLWSTRCSKGEDGQSLPLTHILHTHTYTTHPDIHTHTHTTRTYHTHNICPDTHIHTHTTRRPIHAHVHWHTIIHRDTHTRMAKKPRSVLAS